LTWVGRKVLVLANLKARSLGGFKSHGMVLCASNDDHTAVKFVDVPAAAKVGLTIHGGRERHRSHT
jgi:tRNA-binding EMAP/Myf-like protein